MQVHARTESGFTLVLEGVVTSGEALPAPVIAIPARLSDDVEELPEVVETFGDKWDPEGSQTLEDRLTLIVAESMGYAPEDLPAEIPLMELGLDSLMAVRIRTASSTNSTSHSCNCRRSRTRACAMLRRTCVTRWTTVKRSRSSPSSRPRRRPPSAPRPSRR